MKNICLSFLIIVSISINLIFASEKGKKKVCEITLVKSCGEIIIDGLLNETHWEKAELLSEFWQHSPVDTAMARNQTEILLTYDDNFIYIGAKCYNNKKDAIIQSLKRDNEHAYWRSDAISLIIDPVNTRTNGYFFGVNAGGAQVDGLLSVNGWTNLDTNWDTKWLSSVSRGDGYWIAEIAIPFKSMKFKPENKKWGFNLVRNDMANNIYSTWTKFPRNFQSIDLGHTGNITLAQPPKQDKSKFILIPYLSGGISKDYEEESATKPKLNTGLDAKIAVTPSLNLDLTLNPDFSQVEVDRQVTNLSRFSIYFPEKRSFFLENADLFTMGTSIVKPLFTRKIGYNDGETVPILAGARLSGNITDDTRLGIMTIQTQKNGDFSAQNYSVASVQQKIFKRSTVKGFVINRQATDKTEIVKDDYNRVAGMDFRYMSENGRWRGTVNYHATYTDEKLNSNNLYTLGLDYIGTKLRGSLWINHIGDNYIADAGYVPRIYNYDYQRDTTIRMGYTQLYGRLDKKIYPQNSKSVSNHRIMFIVRNFYNTDGSVNEESYGLYYDINFKNKSQFSTGVMFNEINLPFPIQLISEDDEALPAANYQYYSGRLRYDFDPRKVVSGRIYFNYGGFYNGTKLSAGGEINIRSQPWGNFGLRYDFNDVRFADGYGQKQLHLIGPKSEIAFSKSMFWTTYLQYNTQAENFNINSRLQWRYKPMCDFFVVFTNNYNTFNMSKKDIGLVFKLTYWLNV